MGVPASYQPQGIVHHIGVVYPRRTNQLRLFIPKGHQLAAGTLVTLHLGNRAPRKRHAALAPVPPGHRGGERPSQQGGRADHAGTRTAPHHRAGLPLVTAGRCFSDLDAGNVQVPGTQARAALLLHDRRARQVHLRAVHRMELHQHGNARTTWCPPHRRCTSRFAPRSS